MVAGVAEILLTECQGFFFGWLGKAYVVLARSVHQVLTLYRGGGLVSFCPRISEPVGLECRGVG